MNMNMKNRTRPKKTTTYALTINDSYNRKNFFFVDYQKFPHERSSSFFFELQRARSTPMLQAIKYASLYQKNHYLIGGNFFFKVSRSWSF